MEFCFKCIPHLSWSMYNWEVQFHHFQIHKYLDLAPRPLQSFPRKPGFPGFSRFCADGDGFFINHSWANEMFKWFSKVNCRSKMTSYKVSVDEPTQFVATSHDVTPKGCLVMEIPLFQGNLGWWNIILIQPDECCASLNVFNLAILCQAW